jgi:hypothetical protein
VHAGIADFVDALPGSEFLELDLGGQDSNFVIVEQREKRDVF